MLVIEDCSNSSAVTVLVRGGNKVRERLGGEEGGGKKEAVLPMFDSCCSVCGGTSVFYLIFSCRNGGGLLLVFESCCTVCGGTSVFFFYIFSCRNGGVGLVACLRKLLQRVWRYFFYFILYSPVEMDVRDLFLFCRVVDYALLILPGEAFKRVY